MIPQELTYEAFSFYLLFFGDDGIFNADRNATEAPAAGNATDNADQSDQSAGFL